MRVDSPASGDQWPTPGLSYPSRYGLGFGQQVFAGKDLVAFLRRRLQESIDRGVVACQRFVGERSLQSCRKSGEDFARRTNRRNREESVVSRDVDECTELRDFLEDCGVVEALAVGDPCRVLEQPEQIFRLARLLHEIPGDLAFGSL